MVEKKSFKKQKNLHLSRFMWESYVFNIWDRKPNQTNTNNQSMITNFKISGRKSSTGIQMSAHTNILDY